MKTARMVPKFQAYLAAIKDRTEPSHRLEDWTRHIGDPEATDRDLARYLKSLMPRWSPFEASAVNRARG